MKLNRDLPSFCLLGATLMLAACDMREPVVASSASEEPSVPGPAAVVGDASNAAAVAAQKAALQVGLATIQPLIKEKQAAYQPVEPLDDHRLLLHPGEGKRSRLVIDVSGLEKLTLSPVIENFQGNATCTADPQAGLAGLHWQLDAGAINDVVVDRNYTGSITVDVAGAKQLVIESSDQNGVIWCDWLAVGFTDVAAR